MQRGQICENTPFNISTLGLAHSQNIFSMLSQKPWKKFYRGLSHKRKRVIARVFFSFVYYYLHECSPAFWQLTCTLRRQKNTKTTDSIGHSKGLKRGVPPYVQDWRWKTYKTGNLRVMSHLQIKKSTYCHKTASADFKYYRVNKFYCLIKHGS